MEIKSLILLPLLISCTTNIKVSPKFCKSSGTWNQVNSKDVNFKIIEKAWAIPSTEEIRINKLLKNNKYHCNKLDNYSVAISHDWADALIGLIPFVSRSTVTVSGISQEIIMDDSSAMEGHTSP